MPQNKTVLLQDAARHAEDRKILVQHTGLRRKRTLSNMSGRRNNGTYSHQLRPLHKLHHLEMRDRHVALRGRNLAEHHPRNNSRVQCALRRDNKRDKRERQQPPERKTSRPRSYPTPKDSNIGICIPNLDALMRKDDPWKRPHGKRGNSVMAQDNQQEVIRRQNDGNKSAKKEIIHQPS